MKLVEVPVEDAGGGVLAHGYRLPGGVLPKGTRLGPEELDALSGAGVGTVTVARLAPNDVGEDEAALRVARAAAGEGVRLRGPFTGRANLLAEADGLVRVDPARIGAANAVDEAVTLATPHPFTPVRAGTLVATAKVIPLAVPAELVARVVERLEGEGGAVGLAPFRPHRAGLVLTTLPGTSEAALRKSEAITRARLEALGSDLAAVRTCAHEAAAVAEALTELAGDGRSPLLVLGASAVVDRADVVPRALEDAGGRVVRLGVPVDPGNLLLLGRLAGTAVLGMPGCARSPRRSGFDDLLERTLAGFDPDAGEVAALGVGGLRPEIPSRPQPREREPGGRGSGRSLRVAALVLAAGRSSRMGEPNKLLEEVDGAPMVAGVVDVLLATPARPVVVVTGHEAENVAAALAHRAVEVAHNPDHATGMGSSLRAGAAALPEGLDAVLVCLGDMPRVRAEHVDALLEAFASAPRGAICVPVHARKRGHPVLFDVRWVPELAGVEGDVGARDVLARHGDHVVEVPLGDPGVLVDVDTRDALEAVRRGETAGR